MPCKGFLLDENIDNTIALVLVKLKLAKVRSVRDFPSLHKKDGSAPSATDYQLLAFCLKREWSLCTFDHKMLLDAEIQLALPSNKTPLILFPSYLKKKSVREKAIWILTALPNIEKLARSESGSQVIFMDILGHATSKPLTEAIEEVQEKTRTARANWKVDRKRLREAAAKET